jgi:hypothetical protein
MGFYTVGWDSSYPLFTHKNHQQLFSRQMGQALCLHTISRYSRPILSQNVPRIVLITDTNVSLAAKPCRPAMNCARPPQNATKGKKMVGEWALPHQLAIHDAVMKVEPASPARPSAAGGAIGLKNIVTTGSWESTELTLSSLAPRRAIS